MGRRGPSPKPTALRQLEGNRSKRPLPKGEPKPTVKLPTAPAVLSPEAKRVWNRLGKQLLAYKLVSEIDWMSFGLLCQAWSDWSVAIKAARDEPMIESCGQTFANPMFGRADKEAAKIQKLAAEFGLTPSARSRISLDLGKGDGKPGEDSIEGFLRMTG